VRLCVCVDYVFVKFLANASSLFVCVCVCVCVCYDFCKVCCQFFFFFCFILFYYILFFCFCFVLFCFFCSQEILDYLRERPEAASFFDEDIFIGDFQLGGEVEKTMMDALVPELVKPLNYTLAPKE